MGSHTPYTGGKMYKQSVKHTYINLTARDLEDNRVVVWRIFLVDCLVGILGGE